MLKIPACSRRFFNSREVTNMLEVIVLFMLIFLMAACAFAPKGCNLVFFSKAAAKSSAADKVALQVASKSKAVEEISFLSQLQREIEATLFPRPTDSILQRHYDALVAVELRNRLKGLP